MGVLFVVLASLLWALDTLIRYPLLYGGISAERIVFTEHLFLTLFFLPFLFKNRSQIWQSKISSFFYFLIIGVLGSAVATLCFTKAFMLINPSLVILLQKFQPIVAITLASLLLGEKLKPPFYFWAIISVIGCILISSQDVFPWINNLFDKMNSGHLQSIWLELITEKSMLGYLLTIIAIVSWGSSTVFGKKLTGQGYNEEQIMGGRFTFGFIFLTFYAWSNKQLLHFDWQALVWGKILAMVLISGLLGMYFYYKGLKSISAHVCALAEMFFPLSAVVINWIFLGAKLTIMQIFGAGLLTLSSAVIQIKKY